MTPAQIKIKRWRENPLQFAEECLHLTLDKWQEEALAPLGGSPNPRRRVGMKACTGPGKSFALGIGGWHRLVCFADKGEHPKGAAISGEGKDNLRDNLWSELSKLHQRSEFLKRYFSWTKERIFMNQNPETWFLSARSYAKDADSEAIGRSLSGLHSRYPFALLDEIGDMPPAVGQKATQIFTGGVVDGLIMAAGNPTSMTGLLYQIATHERGQWVLITITADPDDPNRTPRVDPDHAREQIKLHGKDNFWVMATILGLFPPGGMNTLLSPDEVERSMNLIVHKDKYNHVEKRLGVDVARFGDDRTVIFPRQGLRAFMPVIMRNARTNEIAARVMKAKETWKSERELVDDTGGYGGGVIDSMLQASGNPVPINFSSKATDPRYFNKRAEMWFEMANWVKKGGWLPRIPELVRELSAPKYTFNKGMFQLEEKAQIKSRLGFSPDLADALVLTFAIPDMPASLKSLYGIEDTRPKMKAEYDPYAEDRID